MQLQWFKCAGGQWCLLEEADSVEVDSFGVFVVWRAGDFGRTSVVLYVGSGRCANTLRTVAAIRP